MQRFFHLSAASKRIRLSAIEDDLEPPVDKIIFTDFLAAGFGYQAASVVTLKKREGFGELLDMLREKKFELKEMKICILMIGRADIWDNEVMFRLNAQSCISELEALNSKMFILVCGLLPSVGDSRELVRALLKCNDILSSLCVNNFSTREYARPGKKLLNGSEPYRLYFDAQGIVSDEGHDALRDALAKKISAAQIYRRQEALSLIQ